MHQERGCLDASRSEMRAGKARRVRSLADARDGAQERPNGDQVADASGSCGKPVMARRSAEAR